MATGLWLLVAEQWFITGLVVGIKALPWIEKEKVKIRQKTPTLKSLPAGGPLSTTACGLYVTILTSKQQLAHQ